LDPPQPPFKKGGAWKVLLYLKKNATDRIVPFRSFILKVPLIKGDLGGRFVANIFIFYIRSFVGFRDLNPTYNLFHSKKFGMDLSQFAGFLL